jgi:hypothetical protein
VDGCPPNIRLSEKDIQKDMNRRRPGRSKFVSQRKESDKITILSGVFNGKTTGTPISIIISNEDKRSEIMSQLKISLDLDMQILHILKNMELETTEVVVVSRQEKPLLEWLLVPSQN